MTTLTKNKAAIDPQRAEQFAGQFILDLAANYSGVMVLLGLELGLYEAMNNQGPMTPAELAQKTNTHERYIREWLNNQAAGGYITYFPHNQTYALPNEHALVLISRDSTLLMGPAYYVVNSFWKDKDQLAKAFKTGDGIGWHEHHHHLYHGVESIYRTGYLANLNEVWIPSITGITEKLQAGGRVADVGCGHGASTILMAEKFRASSFFGFDYHQDSIGHAVLRAKAKKLANIHFIEADAEGYEEDNFDLICFFDCLHDFGNPIAALRHAAEKLAPQGALLVVEPAAGDSPEDNFHPIGRMYYAASTALCVPHSRSESGGLCLGAQAGPSAIQALARDAGYTQFRVAHRTPVNIVYEIKI